MSRVRGNYKIDMHKQMNFNKGLEFKCDYGDMAGQEWAYVNRVKDLDDITKGHKCKVIKTKFLKVLVEVEEFDGIDSMVPVEKELSNWRLKMPWADFQAANNK
jgi:hypothetical protein